MKVIHSLDLAGTERQVECPSGGFTSYRMLLERDWMGFGMTMTVIPPKGKQHWHYKNHLEACFCISGTGTLTDAATGTEYHIYPGVMYALDKNDDHYFEAHSTVTLVCCFNPPLKGKEVHREDGSYEA